MHGAVVCGHCNTPLTACWAKGKYSLYPYYFCPKRGCEGYAKTVRREIIEGQFETILRQVQPSEEVFAAARAMFKTLWDRRLAANPWRMAATIHTRRARLLGIETHSGAGLDLLRTRWALAGFLGVPESHIHLDHIIPLSRGGTHTDDNLRLLPAHLNMIKGNKLDEEVDDPEFRAWVFGPPTFEE